MNILEARKYCKEIIKFARYTKDTVSEETKDKITKKLFDLLFEGFDLIEQLQAENEQAMRFLQEALPHIECINHFTNGLITAIGTFLQAQKGEVNMSKKIGRNDLCRCGSKIKYKHCCLKKERTIRDKFMGNIKDRKKEMDKRLAIYGTLLKAEIAEFGEAEMLQRDSYVTMRQLQVQKNIQHSSIIHAQEAVNEYKKFVDELLAIPLSDSREKIIDTTNKQIDALKKQIENAPLRKNEIVLSALEEKFEKTPVNY